MYSGIWIQHFGYSAVQIEIHINSKATNITSIITEFRIIIQDSFHRPLHAHGTDKSQSSSLVWLLKNFLQESHSRPDRNSKTIIFRRKVLPYIIYDWMHSFTYTIDLMCNLVNKQCTCETILEMWSTLHRAIWAISLF